MLAELNLVRTNPAEYSKHLDARMQFYVNDDALLSDEQKKENIKQRVFKTGATPEVTKEGVKAVKEASDVLKKQKPVGKLTLSPGMSRAAAELVTYQSGNGKIGHVGSKITVIVNNIPSVIVDDDKTSRQRLDGFHGTVIPNKDGRESVGENVQYGGLDARDIVIRLLIDDGVPGRGHRTSILDPNFCIVGVACGTHPTYGKMCVIPFVGNYQEGR